MDVAAAARCGGRTRAGCAVTAGASGFAAEGWAYLDGEFMPVEEATISIATHAFNYGTGCFEGIRGYWNDEREEMYVVKLMEHCRRLLRSAHLFRMDPGRTAEDLAAIMVECVRRGGFRTDTYIRPIVYKASPVIRVGLTGDRKSTRLNSSHTVI